MNVTAQKFQSLYALVGNRWRGGTIGGHSLSHARWACQLPQGGSRERVRGRVPFNVPLGNSNVAGDFHRPYEGSECFTFYRSSEIVSKWVQKSVQVHCSMGVLNIQLEIYFFQ